MVPSTIFELLLSRREALARTHYESINLRLLLLFRWLGIAGPLKVLVQVVTEQLHLLHPLTPGIDLRFRLLGRLGLIARSLGLLYLGLGSSAGRRQAHCLGRLMSRQVIRLLLKVDEPTEEDRRPDYG